MIHLNSSPLKVRISVTVPMYAIRSLKQKLVFLEIVMKFKKIYVLNIFENNNNRFVKCLIFSSSKRTCYRLFFNYLFPFVQQYLDPEGLYYYMGGFLVGKDTI